MNQMKMKVLVILGALILISVIIPVSVKSCRNVDKAEQTQKELTEIKSNIENNSSDNTDVPENKEEISETRSSSDSDDISKADDQNMNDAEPRESDSSLETSDNKKSDAGISEEHDDGNEISDSTYGNELPFIPADK